MSQFGSKHRFCGSCDLEIGRIALKHNTAPLLCHFKLCASFRIYLGIYSELQSGNSIRVKIVDFAGRVTLKFDGYPEKIIRRIFYAIGSFAHNFVATCELKLELQCGNAQIGAKLDNGDNSWSFPDNTVAGTLWKRCDRETDRRRDGQTDRQTDRRVLKSCLVAAKDHERWFRKFITGMSSVIAMGA